MKSETLSNPGGMSYSQIKLVEAHGCLLIKGHQQQSLQHRNVVGGKSIGVYVALSTLVERSAVGRSVVARELICAFDFALTLLAAQTHDQIQLDHPQRFWRLI